MNIGTRISHRRYSWMVGYIVGSNGPGMCSVAWDSDRYWNAPASAECESDLRATPHQPFPRQHHGDGDEALPVLDSERI